jgi:phospholipid-binding lipoprotein MlaA
MPARLRPLAIALLAAALLSGCAGRQPPQPDYDPWEGLNRKTFWFNDQLDIYALEPLARGWDRVVPDSVQRSLAHFFDNLFFPVVFVNNILQGKPRGAAEALARFEINTFVGGLGFFDLATDFGLPAQIEDTAQTLGVWNISPGPYLVLPFFGPSSPRDTVGLAGDFALAFYTYFLPFPYITVALSGVDIVNDRSRYLDEIANAKEASLDFYIFVRNAYVQRRWKLLNDAISGTGTYLFEEGDEDDLYNEEIYEDSVEQDNAP